MHILIDLQHPAHIHFFRYAAQLLMKRGHTVKFTGRDKDILVKLADELGVEVEVFGVCRQGMLNMGMEMLQRQWRLQKIIRRFRPDVMLAVAGTYISPLGWLFRIPTYVFYDTEHATLSNLIAYPFCNCVYVPRCYRKTVRWRHERYNGYHELAYLHPKYFQPDPSVLDEVGVAEGEIFSLVRFVGWGAVHDIGQRGFSVKGKTKAVNELRRFGPVFISCEGELPPDLEGYRLDIPVSRMHDLMAYAALIFGESATMCSEGAVLGGPSVYVNPLRLGYLEEEEKDYGLVSNFSPEEENDAIARGADILRNYVRDDWRKRGQQLVEDKIDVTELICKVAVH